MPYIITTRRQTVAGHVIANWNVPRRAVATLEEARLWTYDQRMRAGIPWDFPGETGTYGPLPDGTVIEVERVSWVDFSHRYGHANGGQSSLDAFNAAQEPFSASQGAE